jgi:hypothetical protein
MVMARWQRLRVGKAAEFIFAPTQSPCGFCCGGFLFGPFFFPEALPAPLKAIQSYNFEVCAPF